MRPWKHNLTTAEPPLRDTSISHRLSGRVVSLAGGYFAAGRVWGSKSEADLAASKLTNDLDLGRPHKR